MIREDVKIKIIDYFSLSSQITFLNKTRYGFAEIYYPPRESKKNRGKRQREWNRVRNKISNTRDERSPLQYSLIGLSESFRLLQIRQCLAWHGLGSEKTKTLSSTYVLCVC